MTSSQTLAPVQSDSGWQTQESNDVPVQPNRFKRAGRWIWNVLAGASCGFVFPLSFVLLGWLTRWMKAKALLSLWRRSPRRHQGSFEEFHASLGEEAPPLRPNWVVQEVPDRTPIDTPLADGQTPSIVRKTGRFSKRTFASLVGNFKTGFVVLFCTWLITGWGSLAMLFGWEFGWLNSFNKGYEQAVVGPLVSLVGIYLFVVAMFYVPLAQVHYAIIGEVRAFFDVRFLWRLQRSRLGLMFLLGLLFFVFMVGLEAAKVSVLGIPEANLGGDPTSQELETLLQQLRKLYFWCCVALFFGLIFTRRLAVAIYSSALVAQLRSGELEREELPRPLAKWTASLGIRPEVRTSEEQPSRLRSVLGFVYCRLMYVAVFLVLLAAVIRVYPGQFLVRHYPAGFVNFPLVQLPYFNYIPSELIDDVKKSKQGNS